MEELLEKLKTGGGAIVSSKECSPLEIAIAQAEGRMFVDEDGCGFVLRPQIWLESVKAMSLLVAAKVIEEIEEITEELADLFNA